MSPSPPESQEDGYWPQDSFQAEELGYVYGPWNQTVNSAFDVEWQPNVPHATTVEHADVLHLTNVQTHEPDIGQPNVQRETTAFEWGSRSGNIPVSSNDHERLLGTPRHAPTQAHRFLPGKRTLAVETS
ncbi:hypothetical protein LTR37_007628 [Vermiconidia calcicola]|uniref:Uncharacterized protein n=1 Tax=Vermiconidia calcicola TaxID=1690605 RepID=A0ACC3NE96_9PEZI|nr:hypothetical protein LTR37_007628 [Vermiconidia calcicola]